MADAFLDITDAVCPMTFVRVKLQLECMSPGSRLTIRLNGGEPLENIPLSLQEEGLRIESLTADGACHRLVVIC
ncbi:MAG: sulfurtransferase TusA family protein [Magnetococcales bacterium]|nr:sulfurtransferase TusA family protein [Magnetococcales bacterium]MBF0113551.1 sulfurtransferase TusA family protein [Magnetococcales bacterium]